MNNSANKGFIIVTKKAIDFNEINYIKLKSWITFLGVKYIEILNKDLFVNITKKGVLVRMGKGKGKITRKTRKIRNFLKKEIAMENIDKY